MMEKFKRRVVCAANKYNCKLGGSPMVFVGIRHYCLVMRQNMQPYMEYLDKQSEIQGFVDQHGVFMDRKDALEVARNAGQLNIARIKTWPDNKLFSEDLY